MSEFQFLGRERNTIELAGTFAPDALALPAGLEHDGGRVNLFAFEVERLRVRGIPLARWSYSELLWRVAVRRAGAPAWWIVACDLETRGPSWAARRYVRYDVRTLTVEVGARGVRSHGAAGELAIVLGETSGPAQPERRPLLAGGAAWHVPWGDEDTPGASVAARIEVDTLSTATVHAAVSWESQAIVRRGRAHRCGVAHQ